MKRGGKSNYLGKKPKERCCAETGGKTWVKCWPSLVTPDNTTALAGRGERGGFGNEANKKVMRAAKTRSQTQKHERGRNIPPKEEKKNS